MLTPTDKTPVPFNPELLAEVDNGVWTGALAVRSAVTPAVLKLTLVQED